MRSQTPVFGSTLVLVFMCLSAAADSIDAGFTSEQVAVGASLYEENCARCHGVGMVDPGGSFFDLRTFPPSQRSRFMNSVANGKNSMPPWRSVLSQEDIGNLFAYVISAGEKR